MSRDVNKIKKEINENEEENEEYESEENEEENYQDQYLKTTEIVEDNKYEEEPRIKINLEEIEERAPEEEESCISSVILTKEYQKSPKKYINNILILRKLLKYKNILYYYFARWRRAVNHVSLTKSFRKLKKKKKIPINEYKIGDAIIINGAPIDFEKNDNENDKISKKEKILNNLKFFFEFNRSKKAIKNIYLNKWKEFVKKSIEKEHEIEELEQKYKNENLNIFDNINNNDNDNYGDSIFNDNNYQRKSLRKELNVKKNEIVNSKVNKEIKKSFRIGTVNNNFIIKFEEENGNNNKEENNGDNGGINNIN